MGNLITVNYNIERKIKENFDNVAYINKETQNLKYKPIEEEYAYKIKEILKVCQLEREINLDILSNKIIIQHISKPIDEAKMDIVVHFLKTNKIAILMKMMNMN